MGILGNTFSTLFRGNGRSNPGITQKLERALSAEYTVNELIAEATDPANLACMFSGTLFLHKILRLHVSEGPVR